MKYPKPQNETDFLKQMICLFEDALSGLDSVRRALEESRALFLGKLLDPDRLEDEGAVNA